MCLIPGHDLENNSSTEKVQVQSRGRAVWVDLAEQKLSSDGADQS